MLHFVGQTINRRQAHYGVKTGRLIRIARGIYAASDEDLVAAVRGNIVRIARYLLPQTYLSHESALTGTLGSDGVLHLSGRQNVVHDLPGIRIKVHRQPERPLLRHIEVDGIAVRASTPEQALIEMMRAGQMAVERTHETLHRLILRHGSRDLVARRLKQVAQRNGWRLDLDPLWRLYDEQEQRKRLAMNEITFSRAVGWHGEPIGRLMHDGIDWSWEPSGNWIVPHMGEPGDLPPFIANLLPEGWLERAMNKNERELIRDGRRFLGNISLAPKRGGLGSLPQDILLSPLSNHRDPEGVFTGTVSLPDGARHEVMRQIALMWQEDTMPAISGSQPKVPMTLLPDGTAVPAVNAPFTHILKLPGLGGGFESLEALEWTGLRLAAACGLEVASHALVSLQAGSAPGLLVERFDVRRSPGDLRMIFAEDGCSLLGLPANLKTASAFEDLVQAIRGRVNAADRERIMEQLFRRAFLSWAIGDGDAHLKNFGLLQIMSRESFRQGTGSFDQVELAPAYDVVCTTVLPQVIHKGLALSIAGKRESLDMDDWMTLAESMDIPPGDAESILATMASSLMEETGVLRDCLPSPIVTHEPSAELVLQALDEIDGRLLEMGVAPEPVGMEF